MPITPSLRVVLIVPRDAAVNGPGRSLAHARSLDVSPTGATWLAG